VSRPALIAVVATAIAVHPRTLRLWEAAGLVRPARAGGARVYDEAAITRLHLIRRLSSELGLNLAGVRMAIALGEAAELDDAATEELVRGLLGR
jgi:DNA-binding transcriptional MerR regulator